MRRNNQMEKSDRQIYVQIIEIMFKRQFQTNYMFELIFKFIYSRLGNEHYLLEYLVRV